MKKDYYDIIGIGFGPSNLALAIAIEEYNEKNSNNHISAIFIEQKNEFQWHPDMMLPDSNMQISFPKDLATFRNPCSKYTFFNYLFNKNRLVDFVNLKTFYPTRIEFADYLEWASKEVSADVLYNNSVREIFEEQDKINVIIQNEKQENKVIKAKSVVFGMGLRPKIPDNIKIGPRIFHNYNILEDIKNVPNFNNKEIAILGAGQSSAEVITYCYEKFHDSKINVIFSRFGLTPSDSTPYNNRIFDPNTVDKWFSASNDIRSLLFNYHKTTNYSAVDEDLINKIFNIEYQELVTQKKRLFMRKVSKILSYKEDNDKVSIEVENLFTNEISRINVDFLVCATGFSPNDFNKYLKYPNKYDFKDELPNTTRNYQLLFNDNKNKNSMIYLNGCTEHLHGFSATLLSVTAIRVDEILKDIISNLNNL